MEFEPVWLDTHEGICRLAAELRVLAAERAAGVAAAERDGEPKEEVVKAASAAGLLRIGVDTEWADPEGDTDAVSGNGVAAGGKGSGRSKAEASARLAVVQLAVHGRAWVIDALNGDCAAELGKLLRWMLESEGECQVLGFAFQGDIAMLRPLCGAEMEVRTLVDLQLLGRLTGERDTPSLKKVCVRTIGKGLDKAQQCSDWARRPLERAQFLYAALDAHVLLSVHDALLLQRETKSRDGGREVN